MESLEDVDLAKELNFRGRVRFLELVEEELAGLILAARTQPDVAPEKLADRLFRLVFPPLKPRFATLLQVTAARFNLKASLRGWGDDRRVVVDSTAGATLPAVECSDFFPGSDVGRMRGRLGKRARAAQPRRPAVAAPVEAEAAELRETSPKKELSSPSKEPNLPRKPPAGARRGMQGWSDESSDDDWIAKRRKASAASAASGKVVKGRGFKPGGGEDAASAAAALEDHILEFELQKDYAKYTIDPDVNWSPHRKPWAELAGGWEFSGAWSFEPDEQEQLEDAQSRQRRDARGVAVWRVEHAKGGNFSVALIAGSPGEARPWLEGRSSGRGEEPFVLEFRLDAPNKTWEFRFGRATNRQAWKPLPWSNMHRSSFWLATLPGEDGKQHIMVGLDEFPERRFFFAKVRFRPSAFGFGPPAEAPRGSRPEPFYVRDVVIFGRASLLPPPFAQRDHFVELAGRSRSEANKLLERLGLSDKVVSTLELGAAGADESATSLLVCTSSAEAVAVAEAIGAGATAVLSSQWAWPPAGAGDSLEAVRAHAASSRDCWSKLGSEVTRELAIFEEHTQRRTKHLEGMRIEKTSAARTILGNLRGAAPLPKPPEVQR